MTHEHSVHPIVRQIVNRDCHVSMSCSEVVRHVISKLRNGYETFRELSLLDRRQFMEDCVQVHQENWELYCSVMQGTASSNQSLFDDIELPTSLSGEDVLGLMRNHKWTIAALAFRLDLTQDSIRRIRKRGLKKTEDVRYWLRILKDSTPSAVPERYWIRQQCEEFSCCFCGCPLFIGECAYEFENEAYCSHACCRQSRGWK